MNKKCAALAALLALSIMTGAVVTGCGDSGTIPVSSAAGSSAGLTGDTADGAETDGVSDQPKDEAEPPKSESGEKKPQSLPSAGSDSKDSAGAANSAGQNQTAQPSQGGTGSSSNETADDSYFDDAVFIGDSLTEGFQLHGGLTNATYYGFKNLNIKEVFENALVKSDGGKITIAAALKKHNFGKYYIMLGANELGWVYPEVFTKKYGELVDLIKELNPNAKIYLQSVLPVTAEASEKSTVYSNSRIDYYDELISALAAEKGVTYLNVREAVQNENGILPDDAATDGVHLNKDYCKKWADYLRKNQ